MPVDYSHNPDYKPYGQELQTVSFCECGSVLEWHYALVTNSTGSPSPAYRHPNANICPATPFGCPCTTPKWDGQPPRKLTPVGQVTT